MVGLRVIVRWTISLRASFIFRGRFLAMIVSCSIMSTLTRLSLITQKTAYTLLYPALIIHHVALLTHIFRPLCVLCQYEYHHHFSKAEQWNCDSGK